MCSILFAVEMITLNHIILCMILQHVPSTGKVLELFVFSVKQNPIGSKIFKQNLKGFWPDFLHCESLSLPSVYQCTIHSVIKIVSYLFRYPVYRSFICYSISLSYAITYKQKQTLKLITTHFHANGRIRILMNK